MRKYFMPFALLLAAALVAGGCAEQSTKSPAVNANTGGSSANSIARPGAMPSSNQTAPATSTGASGAPPTGGAAPTSSPASPAIKPPMRNGNQ